MTRERLPNRRPNVTGKLTVELDGKEFGIILTVGYRDNNSDQPVEVFSSSFKVGTAMNAIISDACVLLSRLYQHGDNPETVAEGLSQPPSLVGQIALWVAALTKEGN